MRRKHWSVSVSASLARCTALSQVWGHCPGHHLVLPVTPAQHWTVNVAIHWEILLVSTSHHVCHAETRHVLTNQLLQVRDENVVVLVGMNVEFLSFIRDQVDSILATLTLPLTGLE